MDIEIIIALFAVIAAAVFAYLYKQAKSQANEQHTKLNDANEQMATLKSENAVLENSQKEKSARLLKADEDCSVLRERNTQLEIDNREQQTKLKAEQEKLEILEAQFEKQKSQLKDEFKVLSEEIFSQRKRELHEQNKEGIGALIKPLQEQISQFQKRVNDVHSETIKGHTSLETEIKQIMKVGLKIGEDADNLSSALKGDSRQRGAWGEAQLERTLEMSGLIKDTHYRKQATFRDQDGKQKIIDYLIMLPDEHHIVIDSKVSLLAYDRAVAAKDENTHSVAMDDHVKAVKKHIDDLATKDYSDLIGIHSPNYVLMFMPIESAYIEALKWSKDLFGYGYGKNIVLVSHTTLIPILRVVANLWMLEQSNQQVREICDNAGDIHNSVCSLAERIQKLGNTLNTASKHYNDAVTAISGRQGIQGKVERFVQLSPKANKKMPDLKHRHFEYKTDSLDIQPFEKNHSEDNK